MEGQPLLGVLRGLVLDGEEQADFAADPSGYMQRAGYEDMTADDIGEAVGLMADTLPPDVAHAVTTAAAGPEDGAGDEGATGILERLSTIDADDVPPLPIPPPAEPVDQVDDGLDDGTDGPEAFEDAGDATSFGDVDFDDDVAAQDGAEPRDHDEDGDVDRTDDVGEADGTGATDGTGDGFDPFADEAAEPSLEAAEAGGAIPFADAHDVDDDPIDFGEGVVGGEAPVPGIDAADAGLDDTYPSGDDAFGSDAGFDEPALGEPSELDAYGDDPDGGLDGGLDDGFDDDGPEPDAGDDVGLF